MTDGSGREPERLDVLISGGTVAAVAKDITGSAAADATIDLGGAVLAPGFIDVHGHSDISLLAHPAAISKVSQGVTTEIAGNCGLSAFPVTENNRQHLQELYANYQIKIDWDDYKSYIRTLAMHAPALDLRFLCGHNSLRAAVCGYEKQAVSSGDIALMQKILAGSMDSGALGLSTGLLYVPGKFADENEITGLMKTVAQKDGIYATHLRSEGNTLLESLQETLTLAKRAGLKKVHISHFKTAGRDNWDKLDAALEIMENFRRDGITVTCDRYPYVESLTQLSVILPGQWSDMDDVAIQKKLQSAEERLQLAKMLSESRRSDYWNTVRLVSCSDRYSGFCGKKLADISDDPPLLVTELLAADCAGTTASFTGMSEKNMHRILQLDYCMPGSDGNALPPDYSYGRAHPRAFGAVAKFIRIMLDTTGSIGKAVYRATGLPSETFKLAGCGFMRPGMPGNLVAFDPDEIDCKTDFATPHQIADGVILTVSNGKTVYRR